MILLKWIRYFAELCLYFGLILSLPKTFPTAIVPLSPALVLSLTIVLASVISEKVNGNLRFLTLLIPAAYLFFAGGFGTDTAILIPAVLYTVILVIRDTGNMDYYEYLAVFKRVIWFTVIIFIVMSLVEMAFKDIIKLAGTVNPAPILEYGLLYAALGMVLLKSLRLGDDLQKQSFIILVRELFVPAGLIVLFAFVFLGESYIKEVLQIGSQVLLVPLAMVIAVLSEQKGGRTIVGPSMAPVSSSTGGEAVVTGFVPTTAPTQVIENTADRGWIFPVAVILLLTAVMVSLVLSVRKIRGKAGVKVYETEKITGEKTMKRRKILRSNAEKIRGLYRGYLKKTSAKGVKITESMTSGEIRADAADVTADAFSADRLRQLYLSARYDDNADISEEDVKHAAEAVQKVYR